MSVKKAKFSFNPTPATERTVTKKFFKITDPRNKVMIFTIATDSSLRINSYHSLAFALKERIMSYRLCEVKYFRTYFNDARLQNLNAKA